MDGQALPRGPLLALALVLALLLPSHASASQSASLHVALRPEHLGGRTTILFDIQIASPGAHVPSPLIAVNLLYPRDVGLITSGLGLQTCSPAQLESRGRCPSNSLMGYGQALVEFPIGPELIQEHGAITTWMANRTHRRALSTAWASCLRTAAGELARRLQGAGTHRAE
jgi:hypothetical protein